MRSLFSAIEVNDTLGNTYVFAHRDNASDINRLGGHGQAQRGGYSQLLDRLSPYSQQQLLNFWRDPYSPQNLYDLCDTQIHHNLLSALERGDIYAFCTDNTLDGAVQNSHPSSAGAAGAQAEAGSDQPRSATQGQSANAPAPQAAPAPSSQDAPAPKQAAAAKSESGEQSDGTGTTESGTPTQNNATTCTGGEPINLKTGEELLTLTDGVVDGPLPLTFERTYRSSNPHDIGLGYGWTHSLSEHLEIVPHRQQVRLHDGEGRVVTLPLPQEGQSSHNVVEKLSLQRQGKGLWILTPYGAPGGIQRHFCRQAGQLDPQLVKICDGYGNSHRFHYQGRRLAVIESSLGDKLHFIPSPCQRIAEVRRQSQDGQRQVLARFSYDQQGNLVRAEDAHGHAELYQYHKHVIAKRTLKSGYSFHFRWDKPGHQGRCVHQWGDPIDGQDTYNYRFAWDPDGLGVAVSDTRGGVEVYRFNQRGLPVYHKDQEGSETRYQYDAKGLLTRVEHPSAGLAKRAELFGYDRQGRLTDKTDMAGGQYRIGYNDQGLPDSITTPAGHCWRRRYNDKGQVLSSTDPLGNSTLYSYNAAGLVGSVTDPLGNSTRYLWNPYGKLSAVQDPMGLSSQFHYDHAQRLVLVQQGESLHTRYQYDEQDRVVAITDSDGSQRHYQYSPLGLVAAIKDAKGGVTRYEYDGLSQVTRRTNPDGSSLAYRYDGERNLVGLVNEKGEHYRLKYDLKERLVEEVGFDGRLTRYQYDAAGHLCTSRAVTDAASGDGIDIHFERDPFGRLLKESTPEGITRFRYDAAGQITEAANRHRTLRWEYDANGNVIADHQDGYAQHHRYDAAGQRIATERANGETLHFSYNRKGQFTALHRQHQGQGLELLTRLERDQLGREVGRQHGEQLSSERRYDPQGRLKQHSLAKTGGFKPMLERHYQYDVAGNISLIDDSVQGRRHFSYDALNRLQSVQGPNPEHFVHDPASNILASAPSAAEAKSQAQSAQVKGNRLLIQGDRHFEYDVHGNRITERRGKGQCLVTHYRYNSRQQLVRVDKSAPGQEDQITTFQYDALGRRIGKQSEQRSVLFLWDGDVLLSETDEDETGSQVRHYYFEPGTFEPIALDQGGQLYHYHLDHLGTPDTLTDAKGNIVWQVGYRSYGNVALALASDISQPLRFQGQYFDQETGLHYNRFRYYDPNCGQFINQDPIGLLGGLNNYCYVPNPLTWIDPLGLMAKEKGVGCTGKPGTQRWKNKVRNDGKPYSKPGPKSDGAHNDKIQQIIDREVAAGNTHVAGGVYSGKAEMTIDTTGGYKDTRRPDATFKDKNGNIYHYNVGKSNIRKGTEKNGVDPIIREREALDDIRSAGETIHFEPYD